MQDLFQNFALNGFYMDTAMIKAKLHGLSNATDINKSNVSDKYNLAITGIRNKR